ncbi:MAG: 1,4-dihydroxy-2-naphthoate polyprenyltransferase [Bacteroidales bacterium]|nr:1,4-dihydroxy-2-naphthoate polyprenyltransferase [Bacteroidales bacterium]
MKYWIESMRLRTLPLALANTITGSALAWAAGAFRWPVLVLAAFTTLLLQILSNMANDYGDFKNGKDTAERIGPRRMVQSGKISPKAMLRGIVVVVVLAIASGVWLLVEGFSNRAGLTADNLPLIIVFAVLGLGAITAAIRYTVGKNPYGYKALGDVFVFLFFGLVGVIGTYFLHAFHFRWSLLLPASAIGFLSVGVLNLNNLRDYETDKKTGKRTLVVALGVPKARLYHAFLLLGAYVAVSIFTLLEYSGYWQWIFWASFPLMFKNLRAVQTFTQHVQLFPELKRLSMASLLFAVLLALGLIIQ